MTAHELTYCRYLVGELKRMHTESQAKSVLLDSWTTYGSPGNRSDWRQEAEKMTKDLVFRSAVEANLEPRFSRIQRGLRDPATLQLLLAE